MDHLDHAGSVQNMMLLKAQKKTKFVQILREVAEPFVLGAEDISPWQACFWLRFDQQQPCFYAYWVAAVPHLLGSCSCCISLSAGEGCTEACHAR